VSCDVEFKIQKSKFNGTGRFEMRGSRSNRVGIDGAGRSSRGLL
jgi:hypothetical protein